MTDNDKVLINAFLDNETSKEESIYVENLIKKDKEAFNYINLIKKANIKINSFFDEIDLSRDFKPKKNYLNEFLGNFFNNAILSHASAAALFLIVGLNINNLFDYSDTSTKLYLNGFSDKNLKMEYIATKTISSEKDLNEIFTQSLKQTIDEESLTSTVVYGNNAYRLKLNDKIINKNNVICFTGILIGDEEKEFIFCNNNNILSISYK
jgi:hypothetical protein